VLREPAHGLVVGEVVAGLPHHQLVYVAIGILLPQRIQTGAEGGNLPVSLVGEVALPTLHLKGHVAKVERVGVAGVTRRHLHGGEPVRHSRPEPEGAVAARRVSEQVDAIGIDVFEEERPLDQPIQKGVHATSEPHVPRIRGGPGCDVHPLFDGASVAG